jgi:hypothetical protein
MRNASYSLSLLALVTIGCQHHASTRSSSGVHVAQRLPRPEQVIIPPENADWPHQITNAQFPHYPPDARSTGIEARVIVAFVIGGDGRVEPRTISILQSPPAPRGFASSVCPFLRSGAEFSWDPHPPARGLVIMPFEFKLPGSVLTEMLPPMPDLQTLRDSLQHMSPPELAAWVESQ